MSAMRTTLTSAFPGALAAGPALTPPLAVRLGGLAESILALHTDTAQTIRHGVVVVAPRTLSRWREDAILFVAHELIDNAVRHGMYLRLVGRITTRVTGDDRGSVAFSVTNDGWCMDPAPHFGEGLKSVQALVQAEEGMMQVKSCPQAMVGIWLPPEKAGARRL
jgi:signal transduction histidine kinase